MKEDIMAIYETLKRLEMPMTPNNAKHMAGLFIKLEQIFDKLAKEEFVQKQEE